MKTYKDLRRQLGPDCEEQVGPISNKDARAFITKWEAAINRFFGATFDVTDHFIIERLNHTRNQPAISTCELTFVMNKFFKKYQKQFKKDVQDVKDGVAQPRGKNQKGLNGNELEYVVRSESTLINFVFVLKRDRGEPGTAILLPQTIIRKRGFKTIKGVEVFVEGNEIDEPIEGDFYDVE